MFCFHCVISGSQLPEHQEFAGLDLPNCCRHDQGEDSRGDPQDLQHQEWLLSRWRRGGSEREPMGIRVKDWSDEGSVINICDRNVVIMIVVF